MFPQPGGKAIHESGLLKIQTTYIIYNIYNRKSIKKPQFYTKKCNFEDFA